MFDYTGSFHCHSSYSFDGTVAMGEMIAAAKRQKLDFIVVTDHFGLDARKEGWEGWHDGLLVLVGEEISPRYNHYLALGIEEPVPAPQENARPQEYIDAVAAQGGIGLIAHPDHTGARLFGVDDYPWQDWTVEGFDGISVWDLMTDWQEKLTSLPKALVAYLFPADVLSGPKQETLTRWDALNVRRRVAGYGEIDNHDSRKRFFGIDFRIFPFDFAFTNIRTHVVLEEQLNADAAVAKQQLLGAIKAAHLYIAQERWKAAAGFHVRVSDGSTVAFPGDDFTLSAEPAQLEVTVPGPARVRLVRNGAVIAETVQRTSRFEVLTPGVYRIEAAQKRWGSYRPWIYANPIRIFERKA
jgi:hypothetical protein